MKYFLPELLYEYSSDDDEVFVQAQDKWEETCKQYRADFKKMKKPRFVTKLNKIVNHDAEILQTNISKDYFSYILDLDMSFNGVEYREIIYTITEKPKILFHRDLDDGPCGIFWLYDEVSWEGKSGSHSILLTGGFELRIYFKDVKIFDLDKVRVEPVDMWNSLK